MLNLLLSLIELIIIVVLHQGCRHTPWQDGRSIPWMWEIFACRSSKYEHHTGNPLACIHHFFQWQSYTAGKYHGLMGLLSARYQDLCLVSLHQCVLSECDGKCHRTFQYGRQCRRLCTRLFHTHCTQTHGHYFQILYDISLDNLVLYNKRNLERSSS